MRDATFNEGDQGSWVNLPVKMQEFVDKHFAKYQLCIKQAELKLEKGKLDQTEVDAVKQKCIRPFVLMLGTGQPASPAYIKSHLLNMEDGSLKLKEGSQAIMVLFDLFKLEVKIGGLEWVALRVLKAEVQFDGITLQPDNTFLKGLQSAPAAGVPNLEMYDSQGEEEEDAANQETGKDAMTTEQEFEMMVWYPLRLQRIQRQWSRPVTLCNRYLKNMLECGCRKIQRVKTNKPINMQNSRTSMTEQLWKNTLKRCWCSPHLTSLAIFGFGWMILANWSLAQIN